MIPWHQKRKKRRWSKNSPGAAVTIERRRSTMASQSTTTRLAGELHYRKPAENADGYATLTGSGIQDLALTRAHALALFRVVLSDLATDFSQEHQPDSE